MHTHYTLSVAIELGHLLVPPRGLRQLCGPLAAQCRLAERVFQSNSDIKHILLYSLHWANMEICVFCESTYAKKDDQKWSYNCHNSRHYMYIYYVQETNKLGTISSKHT